LNTRLHAALLINKRVDESELRPVYRPLLLHPTHRVAGEVARSAYYISSGIALSLGGVVRAILGWHTKQGVKQGWHLPSGMLEYRCNVLVILSPAKDPGTRIEFLDSSQGSE
jgi:hypothetical protein